MDTDSVLVALLPQVPEAFTYPNGVVREDLHCTIAYITPAPKINPAAVIAALGISEPITAHVDGAAAFFESRALAYLVRGEELSGVRQALETYMEKIGEPIGSAWLPHITVALLEENKAPHVEWGMRKITFDRLLIRVGGYSQTIRLETPTSKQSGEARSAASVHR